MECLVEDDPVYHKSLIGKTFKITTIDRNIHEGVLYVIDPVSKTIVLLNESKNNLKFLMSHAIATLEFKNEVGNFDFSLLNDKLLFANDIEDRRVRLKNWFKKNLIDVNEDGLTLKIQDVFSITPPYTVDQCVSDNELILERMINLIERMP